jgi:cell division protease FtsH
LMYDDAEEEVFLGRSAGQQHKALSGEISKQIDEEVRAIIDECYATSKKLLEENFDKLHVMADTLMLYETIDANQIDDIMLGRPPREPKGWSDTDGGGSADGSADSSTSSAGEKDSTGPIGGPAGEH